MDNINYKVRREFREGEEVLESLSKEDRGKVELFIESLAKDPWARRFSPERIGDCTLKITIQVEDDEISLFVEVNAFRSTVDLIQIKRRGRFKRASDWMAGLVKFEPRQNHD
jgi:hypothetical protein